MPPLPAKPIDSSKRPSMLRGVMWLWLSKPRLHFGVGQFTTHFKTYFSGWIGMFTGGTIWLLTHGHQTPAPKFAPLFVSLLWGPRCFPLTRPKNGCGSKLIRRGYAGFGPCFHLPGQAILGIGFLSHSQITSEPRPAGRPEEHHRLAGC